MPLRSTGDPRWLFLVPHMADQTEISGEASSQQSYLVENTALLKIMLHAAKYPHTAVVGLLLGKVNKHTSGFSVVIEDVVTVSHAYTTLSPILELALFQAALYAQSRGQVLLGSYAANENMADSKLHPGAKKAAERVQESLPTACALQLENSKMSSFLQGKRPDVFQLYVKGGARGFVPSTSCKYDSATAALFLEYHGDGVHHRLSDFEDHLNDISRDWSNQNLF